MRGILAAALLLLWPVCGAAQTFYKDAISSCSVGTFQTDEGLSVRWTGPCIDGKAQGRGIVEWSIAGGQVLATSEGDYSAGLNEGRAITTNYKSKMRAEAEYRGGKMNGRCIIVYADGGRFDGHCADDLRNGFGKMRYANGNRYEGNFQNDMRSGRGVFLFQDEGRNGQIYEGDFADDNPNGRGVSVSPQGDWQQGNFVNGQLDGEGVWVAGDDGAYYQGNFRNGRPDGLGEYVGLSVDGYQSSWAGEWHDGCLVTDDGRTASVLRGGASCGF
jgi:hypothetical protein